MLSVFVKQVKIQSFLTCLYWSKLQGECILDVRPFFVSVALSYMTLLYTLLHLYLPLHYSYTYAALLCSAIHTEIMSFHTTSSIQRVQNGKWREVAFRVSCLDTFPSASVCCASLCDIRWCHASAPAALVHKSNASVRTAKAKDGGLRSRMSLWPVLSICSALSMLVFDACGWLRS